MLEAVLPQERLVVGHQRRRLRSEIGPQQAGLLFDRIRGDAHLVAIARVGIRDVFERLLGARAALVEIPAVVVAPDAAIFDETVRQVGAAMRAVAVDESVGAGQVAIEDEILAHQADGLDRVLRSSSLAPAIGIQ